MAVGDAETKCVRLPGFVAERSLTQATAHYEAALRTELGDQVVPAEFLFTAIRGGRVLHWICGEDDTLGMSYCHPYP